MFSRRGQYVVCDKDKQDGPVLIKIKNEREKICLQDSGQVRLKPASVPESASASAPEGLVFGIWKLEG